MRFSLLAVFLGLVLASLATLTACGGGGSGGSGDPEGARSALVEVLDSARKDDLAAVRQRIDVAEWLASMGHPKAATFQSLPEAERDELAKSCFRSVTTVLRLTKLPDRATIDAAVKSGSIENMAQLKAAQIAFQAPDAERAGKQLTINAKLRYGIDRVWRLVTIEADL